MANEGPDDTGGALARLEARVRELEDRLAILQVMASYGPGADSGSGDLVRQLFTEAGTYDSGIEVFEGAEAIGDMIDHLPLHRELMAGGCAHMITMPVVHVTGDRAVATCHGQLLRHQGDGFAVWRTSATRWELARTPDGWRVARRVNRVLDGDRGAQALFREALLESTGRSAP